MIMPKRPVIAAVVLAVITVAACVGSQPRKGTVTEAMWNQQEETRRKKN